MQLSSIWVVQSLSSITSDEFEHLGTSVGPGALWLVAVSRSNVSLAIVKTNSTPHFRRDETRTKFIFVAGSYPPGTLSRRACLAIQGLRIPVPIQEFTCP